MKRFNWFAGSVIIIGGMVFAPLAFAVGTAGGAGGGGAAAGGAGGGNGGGANGAAGGQTGAGGTNASGNNSGNPGTGNPLGASPGGSNPLGTAPGTSPLGSGPGGSNPLGTTQNQGQATRPSTVDPNSSTNDINGHGFNQNNLGTSNAGNGSGAGAGSGIGTSQQQGATGSGVGLPDSSGNGVPSNAQTHYGDEHTRSENMNNSRNGLNGSAQNNGLSNSSGSVNPNQDWRQVYYDNHWWYYTPSNNWLYYDSNRWNAYSANGNRSGNGTNPALDNSNTNGAYNGQYGVGYRGNENMTSIEQDMTPAERAQLSRNRLQNQSTLNGHGSARSGGRSAVSSRPMAPTEQELRTFEQRNFNNTGTGINNPTDRTQPSPATTSGPGLGVDSTGIPIQSGQPQK
jgi:hypothetical protein